MWSKLFLRVRKAQVEEAIRWQAAVEEYYANELALEQETQAWRKTWQEEHQEANLASAQQMEAELDESKRRERH